MENPASITSDSTLPFAKNLDTSKAGPKSHLEY